ncbi:MAG: ribulokinase [Salinivenus sp.]
MPDSAYTIGLDYGTQSVRALVVDVRTGEEVGTGVFSYPSGANGTYVDPDDPNLARQAPQDYLDGLVGSVQAALDDAQGTDGFRPAAVVGLGVDTTGSTPIPVDEEGVPLAFDERFADDLAAKAWLWKDHTGHAEAEEITETAREMRPQYLAKCGGTYSSEWFWAKLLHCCRVAPEVFEAAHTWVEHADWMPAVLTGTDHPADLKRGVCAAGHKAMYNEAWGGYPDEDFLAALDDGLVEVRRTLPDTAHTAGAPAGTLTDDWADRLGLPAGIPVSVGAFDAHLGAIGAGIEEGTLVKVIGTSTCDLMVAPLTQDLADIPGLAGIVPESILPGYYGLEAGQSAVGDIFNWFVDVVQPDNLDHDALTERAAALAPGESGLLALDWHNGNRTVLVDQRLTGGLLGLTLHSTPAEMYRAYVEATAFGARVIMERLEEYGVAVERIVNCGGISTKNEMVMQIYADVLGRPQRISRSGQTPALGAAVAGSVAAGPDAGGHPDFDTGTAAMTGTKDTVFEPIPEHRAVYDRLYRLYRRLHDAFGVEGTEDDLYDVMKALIDLRDEVRG